MGGLVENEEQDENKKMKPIVVEEQEQEQEGSETRFVDLDEDSLYSVLNLVDAFTLGRAACVNRLWHKVAGDKRLWEPIYTWYLAGIGKLQYIDIYRTHFSPPRFRLHLFRRVISDRAKPPPDFYSIDFSEMITPWV